MHATVHAETTMYNGITLCENAKPICTDLYTDLLAIHTGHHWLLSGVLGVYVVMVTRCPATSVSNLLAIRKLGITGVSKASNQRCLMSL